MARIKIQDEYKIVCTAEFPGTPATKDGKLTNTTRELQFVGVFEDLADDEIESIQQQMTALLRPVFDLLRKVKSGTLAAEEVQQAEDQAEAAAQIVPLIERKLKRIEGLEIEAQDGSLLDDDGVRRWALGHPKLRRALEAGFGQLNDAGGAGLGNLLKSVGATRG
jgi:hypothetical protein